MKAIFNTVTMLATAALLTFGLAGQVSAGGCMPDVPCLDDYSAILIGGAASHEGFGGAVFDGGNGSNLVELNGSDSVDINLDVSGSGCTVNCGNTSYSFKANARQDVLTKSLVNGNTPNVAAQAANQGSSAAIIQFELGKIGFGN